ncbi:MAG TPA: hypothetical protein VHF91_03500 [Acidimicrobiales bacterium]|nr:hypothetical protein [Acidimicrobiales bacterium]
MSGWVGEASPLQEIERRVQLRAKETALDMAGADGGAKLRGLIAEEVGAWSDAYKRGLRAFDLAEPDLVAERAYRNLAGYGPLEPLLADDDVWEIMVGTSRHLLFRETAGQVASRIARCCSLVSAAEPRLWCRCGAERRPDTADAWPRRFSDCPQWRATTTRWLAPT